MSATDRAIHDIERIDKSAFNIPTGARAGVFVAVPLLLGIVTGQEELVYATLGALLVANSEGPLSTWAPLRLILVACIVESVAFGLGTLAGTTGLAAIPLLMAGVFIALLLGTNPQWSFVSMFTAIFFAVGVGLPGASVAVAGDRLVLSFAGGLWGLTGLALYRIASSRTNRGLAQQTRFAWPFSRAKKPLVSAETINHGIIVGVASGIGLAIGFAIGLPRDFWIVVTIILAIRPSLGGTVVSTSMIVIGTAAGAVIAAIATVEISDDYVLWVLLLVVSFALFATRGINLGLTQVFFTPFVIILLNILYPGMWQLAEVRILDVAIGGAISLLVVYSWGIRRRGTPARAVGPPSGGKR